WMFERKGVFAVDPGQGLDESRLLDITLEVGGEDLRPAGDGFVIHCAPSAFSDVRAALERRGVALTGGEIGYVPTNRTAVADVDGTGIARFCLADGVLVWDPHKGLQGSEQLGGGTAERPRRSVEELLRKAEGALQADGGRAVSALQRLLHWERQDTLLHRLQ